MRVFTVHAKISAYSLAESTSINPKQCRKLKLNSLTGKSRKSNKRKWRPLSEGLERDILIHPKFDQFNENNKYINQSTNN